MERDGLLNVEGDRHLELSRARPVARDPGHAQAPAGRVPAGAGDRPGVGAGARRRPAGGSTSCPRPWSAGCSRCSATRPCRRTATRSPAWPSSARRPPTALGRRRGLVTLDRVVARRGGRGRGAPAGRAGAGRHRADVAAAPGRRAAGSSITVGHRRPTGCWSARAASPPRSPPRSPRTSSSRPLTRGRRHAHVSVHDLKACRSSERPTRRSSTSGSPRSSPRATCPAPGWCRWPRCPPLVGDLPTDRPVYVICAVGGRSGQAAQFLAQHGVDAVNVAGGTGDWLAAGYPVER